MKPIALKYKILDHVEKIMQKYQARVKLAVNPMSAPHSAKAEGDSILDKQFSDMQKEITTYLIQVL